MRYVHVNKRTKSKFILYTVVNTVKNAIYVLRIDVCATVCFPHFHFNSMYLFQFSHSKKIMFCISVESALFLNPARQCSNTKQSILIWKSPREKYTRKKKSLTNLSLTFLIRLVLFIGNFFFASLLWFGCIYSSFKFHRPFYLSPNFAITFWFLQFFFANFLNGYFQMDNENKMIENKKKGWFGKLFSNKYDTDS